MSAIVLVYVSETILREKFEEFLSLEIEIMEDDRRFKTPASFQTLYTFQPIAEKSSTILKNH